MNRIFVATLTLLAIASFTVAAPAPVGNALPTVAELQDQLKAGQAQEVSRSVAKLLALKGEPAKQYDRYELLMLRGEAALRTKQNSIAVQSFAEAAKEAADDTKKSMARANELLLRKSKPTGYVSRAAAQARPAPGVKPAGPMPIVEEADRKAAMNALLTDELTTIEPRLNAARNAAALPPIAEAAKALGDVRAIEIAATDASDKTKSIGADLGEKAHGLISEALRSMEARVEEVWGSASRHTYHTNQYGQKVSDAGLFGMTSVEANDVKGVMQTCEKLMPTAADFAAVTGNAELKADSEKAQQLYARAKEVVEYDYANAQRRRPTVQNPPIQNLPGGGNVTIGR